jgi:eukaryotic-like serine/threonine-protein kinase
MPRNLVTNGIRALGRLAFIEHHSSLMTNLERSLKEVISLEAEQEVTELTRLPMRTKEPIVYIVSHLGGGTGSGMFLDCAYLVKSILRKKGLGGEVAGILLSPELLDGQSPDLPEANAVAALHELDHFQKGLSSYQVKLGMKSDFITDHEPPFSHCMLVEVPARPLKLAPQQIDPATPVLTRLARCLVNVLTHPLGQTSEPSWLCKSASATYQTISTQVVTTSRKTIMQQASGIIRNQVIDHWLRQLPPEQIAQTQHLMNEFLQRMQLSSALLSSKLDQTVTQVLGAKPADYCQQMLADINKPIKEYLPTRKEIDKALHHILDLLGSTKADDSVSVSMIEPSTKVTRELRAIIDQIVETVAGELNHAVRNLVDKPNWRLNAAEEGLLYITRVLEKSVEHNNAQHQQCQKQFAVAVARLKNDLSEYDRLRSTTKFLWPKVTSPAQHLTDIFAKRYQSLLHERLVTLYGGLAARCTGFVQDLRQCRSRLLDLRQSGRRQDDSWKQEASPWKTALTPPGFSDDFQVVQQLSDSISAEDMANIDTRLATKLAPDYPSLVETALATGDSLRPLRKIIQEEVLAYLDTQMPQHEVLNMMLEEQPNICDAVEKLHKSAQLPINFHQVTKSFELVFLTLPESEQTVRLEKEIHRTFPDLVTVRGQKDNEVILHRAILGLKLQELSVMSEAGQEAYETAKGIENFSPHSRQDIVEWAGQLAAT